MNKGKNTKLLFTVVLLAVGVYFIISNLMLFAIVGLFAGAVVFGYILYKRIKERGIGIFGQ